MIRKANFKHFTWIVLFSLITGALVGHFKSEWAIQTRFLSQYFIEIIKVFIIPVVFVTIVAGILGMKDLRKAGRIGIKSLLYFEIVSTIALALGVIGAFVFKPGILSLDLKPIASSPIPSPENILNLSDFFFQNTMLQVVVVSICTGIVVHFTSYKEKISQYLNLLGDQVFKLLHYVMLLAPLAAFGGMAFTVGKFGLYSLLPLAKLLFSVYFTMGIFIVCILGGILYYTKKNIFKLLKTIQAEILLVLGTSSSESALPSLMNKLERLGCSQSVTGLVVPSGYSFNLDGTSIYLSMSVIFISQLYNIPLQPGELLTLIGILMITSKGAAAVTGSGFIILASTLTALNKLPIEGLTFLIGIDKFMSEARAITNLIGNSVACIVIAESESDTITL